MFPKPNATDFCWILVSRLDRWELGNPESCIFDKPKWWNINLRCFPTKSQICCNERLSLEENKEKTTSSSTNFKNHVLNRSHHYPHLHPSPPPLPPCFVARFLSPSNGGYSLRIPEVHREGRSFLPSPGSFGWIFCIQMTSDMSITNRKCWWMSNEMLGELLVDVFFLQRREMLTLQMNKKNT